MKLKRTRNRLLMICVGKLMASWSGGETTESPHCWRDEAKSGLVECEEVADVVKVLAAARISVVGKDKNRHVRSAAAETACRQVFDCDGGCQNTTGATFVSRIFLSHQGGSFRTGWLGRCRFLDIVQALRPQFRDTLLLRGSRDILRALRPQSWDIEARIECPVTRQRSTTDVWTLT